MQVKHAIFDMDGTLLDSMYVWDNVGRTVLENYGVPVPEDLRQVMRSMTVEDTAQYFCRLGVQDAPKAVEAQINRIPYEKYLYEVQPKPGAVEFLCHLQKLQVPMCIVSSTDEKSIRAAFDRLHLTKLLSFILSTCDFGSGKDKPEIFYEAARRLGGRPEDTTVFEDALYAIHTAKTAGFQVVALEDARAKNEREEIRKQADIYLPDLRSFPWEKEQSL
ncbi:MAG: HAD family phosphatase [Oscillospiraceae bacterium]|jgi:HAD superfamily hydrolase (TIGR01509 family)|nr:HAD family phosphatase [Oscillospiraceae bacterium]